MRHSIFSLITLTMPPSSSSLSTKPRKHSTSATTTTTTGPPPLCRHHSPSATATLDLLILILVLISGAFLLTSYFSYIFNSLSLLLPSHSFPPFPSLAYLLGFAVAFSLAFAACCGGFFSGGWFLGFRSRRCGNPKCKGLKKAMEFDLQLQREDYLKSSGNEIDKLPWKGGTESNPDYECLRAELRKMAPPNGRAVLLFRAKCGCPVAKLVGWGPKKGRKHKRSLANVAANGDHR